MAIVIDPSNFDKNDNLIECVAEMQRYGGAIGVGMPRIDVHDRRTNYNGLYTYPRGKVPPTITIAMANCRRPAIVPVRSWTYTGYKCDMTPAGVFAHEYGHHVDAVRSITYRRKKEAKEVWDHEGCISSYCPSLSEWFAETFRVWVLNPNFLEMVKPVTAEFMVACALPKAHDLTWQQVLEHADPKWHSAATNHVKRSEKSVGHKMRQQRLIREAKEREALGEVDKGGVCGPVPARVVGANDGEPVQDEHHRREDTGD